MQVVGFLDDNPSLKDRVMQGFRIFGDLDYLEEFVEDRSCHGIIVTITQMDQSARERVNEVAKALDLTVYEWALDPRPRIVFPKPEPVPDPEAQAPPGESSVA